MKWGIYNSFAQISTIIISFQETTVDAFVVEEWVMSKKIAGSRERLGDAQCGLQAWPRQKLLIIVAAVNVIL